MRPATLPKLFAAPAGSTRLLLTLFVACADPEPSDPPSPPAWVESLALDQGGWLLSSWGPAKNDVYAVGGSPERGLITHFDGQTWTPIELGFDVPLINWVHGFGPTDVYFVGTHGTILHFDGARFTKSATVTSADLWGVFCAAPDDVWAVGGGARRVEDATVLHYDGIRWERMSTPELQHPNVFSFFKVWGTSSRDVYVVGQRGVVLRWDGASFTELFVGSSEDLVSVWGTGPSRIAIVGGRSNGELVTFDGIDWAREPLAPLPGLNGVWFRDPSKVHIGGEDGTVATYDWESREVTLEVQKTHLSIHALFGVGGKLHAVGGSLLSIEPPHRGVVLTRELRAEE
ncbi:MAG: hypothetical protein HY791_06920 [Deltaproteobacteria bacterium]|nr:hypothetical protein [Deltaproteobacteria bacterium]